ncbi:unnamed protein product [Rotaria sp. Silwood1]|nr:unnamed protein product [Rotaria sp. Silwood1]
MDQQTNEIKKYLLRGSLQTTAGGNGDDAHINQITDCYSLVINSDASYAYVSDLNNNRICRCSLKTLGDVFIIAGRMGLGNELNYLAHPRGIHVIKNHFYVADTGNGRLMQVELNTSQISIVISGSHSSFYRYQLNQPTSIISDQYDKNFYIADQGRILQWRFNVQRMVKLVDNRIASIGNEIYGLKLTENDCYLYATDKLNYRILKINTMISKCIGENSAPMVATTYSSYFACLLLMVVVNITMRFEQ